ncbi:MAG TPA: hypothetical protein VFN61_12390 [Acidimicrobiales bacterium]|nr:hypothetical protein [Acidimicrobiales bacterium]
MHDRFEQLQADALALAKGFRPELLAKADLEKVVVIAGRIANAMSALANLAAAHIAESEQSHNGERKAGHHLAAAAGIGHGRARARIDAVKKLSSCPEAVAAARNGELSDDQVLLLSDAIGEKPEAAAGLVGKAKTSSLKELADEVARARAEGRDQEERRTAVRAGRSLRSWTTPDGTWHLHAQGLPEDGAKVMAAVNRHAGSIFDQARSDGRHDRLDAYAFDALVALATSTGGATATSTRTDILVRVDLSALLRGYSVDDEVCEIAGFGPVSAQAIFDMMSSGDPFLKAIVTKAKDVVSIVHLGRRPNAYQASALDWLFPTCAAQGCPTRAEHLQSDHREDWSRTHVTVLHLLDRLCRFHHDLKTYEGWRLVPGKGKRPFVPPSDNRHPGSPRTYPRRTPPAPAPRPPTKTPYNSLPAADHSSLTPALFPNTDPQGNDPCPSSVSATPSSAPSTSSSRTSTSTGGPPSTAALTG